MTFRVPLDFSAVEEYEVLDSGVYAAVIERLRWHEQKEGQKADQIEVQYTITEDGEVKGEKISQWLSFSSKALFRMRDFFDAFGEDYEELEVDEPEDGVGVVLEPDLSGIPVEIKVIKEKHYKDKNRYVNKINDAPVPIEQKRARPTRSSRAQDEDDGEDEPESKPARSAKKAGTRREGRSIR